MDLQSEISSYHDCTGWVRYQMPDQAFSHAVGGNNKHIECK